MFWLQIAIGHLLCFLPASILYKSIAGRYRPVRVADGPITARYIFIKNAYWVHSSFGYMFHCDVSQMRQRTLWGPNVHVYLQFGAASDSMVKFRASTCLCNVDPLKSHFYIVKLWFTGVYIIFLISAQKRRLRVPTIHVLSRNMKNIRIFHLKFFIFCGKIFYIFK